MPPGGPRIPRHMVENEDSDDDDAAGVVVVANNNGGPTGHHHALPSLSPPTREAPLLLRPHNNNDEAKNNLAHNDSAHDATTAAPQPFQKWNLADIKLKKRKKQTVDEKELDGSITGPRVDGTMVVTATRKRNKPTSAPEPEKSMNNDNNDDNDDPTAKVQNRKTPTLAQKKQHDGGTAGRQHIPPIMTMVVPPTKYCPTRMKEALTALAPHLAAPPPPPPVFTDDNDVLSWPNVQRQHLCAQRDVAALLEKIHADSRARLPPATTPPRQQWHQQQPTLEYKCVVALALTNQLKQECGRKDDQDVTKMFLAKNTGRYVQIIVQRWWEDVKATSDRWWLAAAAGDDHNNRTLDDSAEIMLATSLLALVTASLDFIKNTKRLKQLKNKGNVDLAGIVQEAADLAKSLPHNAELNVATAAASQRLAELQRHGDVAPASGVCTRRVEKSLAATMVAATSSNDDAVQARPPDLSLVAAKQRHGAMSTSSAFQDASFTFGHKVVSSTNIPRRNAAACASGPTTKPSFKLASILDPAALAIPKRGPHQSSERPASTDNPPILLGAASWATTTTHAARPDNLDGDSRKMPAMMMPALDQPRTMKTLVWYPPARSMAGVVPSHVPHPQWKCPGIVQPPRWAAAAGAAAAAAASPGHKSDGSLGGESRRAAW